MSQDERFEVTVISIPRRFTSDSEFAEEDIVSQFLDDLGVPHLRFSFANSIEGLERIRKLAPDYVFINYPWQRNYQPGYRVEHLSEFTKICYVPYYALDLVADPKDQGLAPYHFEQRSHQLASLIFTQDVAELEAYAKTSRGNKHVHLTGTPKLDALIRQVNEGVKRWPISNSKNTRMTWAPHHSYSPAWLNFGNFPQIHQQMLEFAGNNPKIDIVMRPHPLMFSTLVNRGVMDEKNLAIWLDSWNALPNTAIDDEGEIARLFAATDVLVTDGISFLGEYPLATGKPAIFIEHDNHWPWSPLGELAAAANIRVRNFDEFENVLKRVLQEGTPDFSQEIATLLKAAVPYPGKSATKIIEIVVDDFDAQTPLVNKDAITETAWENRPGTEPSWD